MSFVDSVDDLAREVIDDLYVRRFYRDLDGLTMSRQRGRARLPHRDREPVGTHYPTHPAEGSAEAMRCRLAVAAREELDARKHALGLMTHDDQLTRLRATLGGRAATRRWPHAAQSVHGRADRRVPGHRPDPVGDRRAAFGSTRGRRPRGNERSVLIGDPKQAIYAFRGADVYTYLAAAESAGARATLAVNRRSDKPLLDGLDALFGHARLGHPGIVYRHVDASPIHQAPRLRGAPGEGALRVRLLDAGEPDVADPERLPQRGVGPRVRRPRPGRRCRGAARLGSHHRAA